MTKKEMMFDAFFKAQGGIFPAEDPRFIQVKGFMKTGIPYLEPQYPNVSDINVDIIRNIGLNAVAGKDKEGFYLGINIGSYFLIVDMFNKLMATKSVEVTIGDVSLETDEKKVLNAILENGTIAYDLGNSANLFASKDPIRQDFARYYTTLVINFLIFHELGHIVRGHVGYCANRFNYSTLNEVQNADSKLDPLMSRTFEMDADSFAVNHAFIIGMNRIANTDTLHFPEALIFKDEATFLSKFIFATYCLFKLFEFEDFNPGTVQNLSHPPPSVRVSMIVNNIIVLLNHHKIKNIDYITDRMRNSIVEAEKAFSEIRYVKNNTSEVFFSNHVKAVSYIKQITENWNNVRPLLEPYAFGDLPPLVTFA